MNNNIKKRLKALDSDSIFGGDKVIWMVLFLLSIISVVEVYSASSNMTYKTGNYWAPALYHLVHIGVGWLAAILVCRVPCVVFKIIPILGIPVSVILLLYAMFSGEQINGASRWVAGFQPSEVAKGVMIVTAAFILSFCFDKEKEKVTPRGFKWCIGIAAVICALILPENLSTAAMLFGVIIMMMFVGRADWRWLLALVGPAVLCAGMFFMFLKTASPEMLQKVGEEVPALHRLPTWAGRVRSASSGTVPPDSLDLSKNQQVIHAKIAVATCNIVGKGPGKSVERDFLPQAYADFIFAIIIEEFGLPGALVVVFLYITLLFRAGMLASQCERRFPALLCMGLALLIVVQAMFNICVCVGLLPVTGQQLPLISRGGTGMIFNCIYIGMILSVSRNARQAVQARKVQPLLITDNNDTDR